jgi:hypothetical protein
LYRIYLFDKQRSTYKSSSWDLNNKKWHKWCKFVLRFLFYNTSGLPVLTKGTKCTNKVFCVWLVDLQTIALNTGLKHDSLQMMILLYVFSTFIVVDAKSCFETCITRNDVYEVNLFLFSSLITLMIYLCSHCSPNVQLVFFIFHWPIYRLFLLNRGCKLEPFQMMIFVHDCSTCSVVELKNRFEAWISRNVVNGVNLILFSYLITLTTYLCSQWAPNVQIKYFMFYWSVYMLLVLYRGWKRESHQIMIFVYVCSTCSVVELKPRFEKWITRNVVNGVNLFNLLI